MNSFTHETNTRLEQQRQQLETLIRQSKCETVYRPSRFQRFWSRLISTVVHRLTAGNEPRISHKIVGEVEVWKVYDPVDCSLHAFTDETEVRAWIDQRYSQ